MFCLIAPALASALALLLSASLVAANCAGQDLRTTLTDAERAELDTRITATPYAEGNVWTATRGARILHLIGTMHLDDPRFDAILPRLAPLVTEADLLLVEATEEEQAKLQNAIATQPDLIFLTSGPTLPDLLSETDWQALSNAAAARGLPGFMAAKMQPWYLSVMLTTPPCAMAALQAGPNGLDHRIMELATRAGVPQRPLEPFDTLFRLMAETPLEDQARHLTLGLLPAHVTEDAFATLKASYFEERPAEVLEINRLIAQRHVDLPKAEVDALLEDALESLLERRNRAWIDVILAAPDGVTVIAAGAAHWPGQTGVLALLEAEGFTLTRRDF